jgi:RNA polymerase sigma factor (sigma-70 family)
MRSLLENVVRGAELLAARSDSLPLTDGEIVRRLTHDRDQSAFVLLVRRHAPLVWGVCRQMLPNDQDAEDAFQATFLALVRSLDKVRKQQSLGPWLHGVAYRIAMKVRREAVRRKQREARAGLEEQAQPVADSTWNRLQGIVHEEIASLPDHLREAFVLCCLEGRSQHEAAEQLGWKLGTLSARVTQARQRLLDRLTRRDIALSMAAGMLGSQMASRPALALSQSTVSLLSARIESIPTTISTLAHGVVPMMWTRTKLAVLGIVFGGLVTTGIGWMATSEAQTPAIQAEVDYLLKALRDEKTEYRFVQIVKPLTIDEMKKVLATSEYEGWSYCGTQDLMTKEGKPQPHMVFKRGKTSVTQEQDLRRKLEETLAREEAERRKQFKPEEIESVTAQLKLMELKLVELQQAKAKALQTGNPAQAKLIEQEIMANDVAIKKIRHYADAMKQAAESSNHKSAITEDEVGIARMKAEIEAKVRGEVQDQLKAVERERALATQAAHEQKRYRELNDNIASAEKRILEIKAVLDIANKAGSKSDIQRYTNEIKATEELKKKLEEIRSKEQSEQLKRHSIPTKQESRTVSDAEDRIARIRAERKSLDENLKPHHDLDLSRIFGGRTTAATADR